MTSKLERQGAASRLLWTVSPILDIIRDGWRERLHVKQIAALQSWRDGDGEETPTRLERQHNWAQAINDACAKSKTLPCRYQELRREPIVMGGEAVGITTTYIYLITAQDFAQWLAAHGEAPGPLVQLWFESQGVASPAPAPAQAAAPAPVAGSADTCTGTGTGPGWPLTKPKRCHGYTQPLYRLLADAHRDGKPRPSAREVLEAWRIEPPAEIAKVLPDGFDFYDAKGNTKSASLDAIRKAIERMTDAR